MCFAFPFASTAAVAGYAWASVVTFEDVPTLPDGLAPALGTVGSIRNYEGFDWFGTNTSASDPLVPPNSVAVYTPNGSLSGYSFGTTSGTHAVFSAFGAQIWVSRPERWSFEGAYFNAAWRTGLSIELLGIRDGVTVFSMTKTLGSPAGPESWMPPEWIDANFSDIDQLKIRSFGGTPYIFFPSTSANFTMDDFTYSVPAPPTLIAIVGALWRIQRARRQRFC